MRQTARFLRITTGLALLLPLSAEWSGAGECVHPDGEPFGVYGDVNASGVTNVADALCALLYVAWSASAQLETAPGCVAVGPQLVDTSCDGAFTVADVQIIVRVALGVPLDPAIDPDGTGCPAQCVDLCAQPCDDGFDCTTDTCEPGVGCIHQPVDALCPDDGPCLSGSCEVASGCVSQPNPGAPCDDGDPCTDSDECDTLGACAGAPIDCDDGVECTLDTCEGGVCGHEADDGACPDGLPCSSSTCDAAQGCQVATFPGEPCDDGDPCTESDTCSVEGACVGAPIICEDGLTCTLDACVDGACVHTPDDSLCPEGLVCVPELGDPFSGCTLEDPGPQPHCSGPADAIICEVTSLTAYPGQLGGLPAGDYVECTFNLAAISEACTTSSCRPQGMQAAFEFDATRARIQDIVSYTCLGGDAFCGELANTTIGGLTATPMINGHSMAASPSTNTAWNETAWSDLASGDDGVGAGALIIAHSSDLEAPLAEASMDGAVNGDPVGDPALFRLYFVAEPGYEPSPADPFRVCGRGFVITNGLPQQLAFEQNTSSRALVTWLP